jgi:hypothetical protein
MGEITTVKLSKKTRDRLAELGRKQETYEDIIERLIESYQGVDNKKVSPSRGPTPAQS